MPLRWCGLGGIFKAKLAHMTGSGGYAGWHYSANAVSWNASKGKQAEPCQVQEAASNAVQERINSGLTAGTSHKPSQLLETVKLLASGGFAGAFSKSCTAPLARLTILYQVWSSIICLRNSVRLTVVPE